MLAKDLVSEIIAPLDPSDTGAKGLQWMEVFRVSHLPVVSDGDFLGLISDTDIFDQNMINMPVGDFLQGSFTPFAYGHQHLYEIIEMVSRLNLTAVPVLADDRRYLGVISQRQLILAFGDTASVKASGGVLVLELNANDYSLSEIARIVEDNNAKILSCYVSSPPESLKMEVTLKINRVNVTSVIQDFLRYDYTVTASVQGSDHNGEILRNNYDQFMMYLNV